MKALIPWALVAALAVCGPVARAADEKTTDAAATEPAANHNQQEVLLALWHAAMDWCRATGDEAGFESLAIDYATHFEKSPPMWVSLPQQLGLPARIGLWEELRQIGQALIHLIEPGRNDQGPTLQHDQAGGTGEQILRQLAAPLHEVRNVVANK